LIDADGRILALARGAGRPTLERIAAQAGRRLEELDPMGATRFAAHGDRRAAPAAMPGANDQCPLAKVRRM